MNNYIQTSSAEKDPQHGRIWISWHYHRRSDYLSREFGCSYYHFGTSARNRITRYLIGTINTLKILIKKRPKILFVQNPSLVLTTMTVIIKPFFKYILVNDLHTPFIKLPSVKNFIFWKLQYFAIKHSDITIVTNEEFSRDLKEKGIMVLPDIIPEFETPGSKKLSDGSNILYVCTFAEDEPYNNIIKASSLLDKNINIYITGNYKKAGIDKSRMPHNIHLTGYLPDKDYLELMNSVDIVMVLTEQSNCIVCGGYEGVSLSKPLILSNTMALRDYFSAGAIYTEHDPESIVTGIRTAIKQKENLKSELPELKSRLAGDWHIKFELIQKMIGNLEVEN
ncbi:MAG: glycosyltransferase [Candidatus Krumholzibacteriota bacterium]|nr:glycosyltransferase [Candidatus Krumholzibacteriota bacterium]